ncbi:MAG TPA: hypothetical protein VE981_08720 [Planctomycetota bacterium]|nr:hypothetical protein [Planctomycetota bacterium]
MIPGALTPSGALVLAAVAAAFVAFMTPTLIRWRRISRLLPLLSRRLGGTVSRWYGIDFESQARRGWIRFSLGTRRTPSSTTISLDIGGAPEARLDLVRNGWWGRAFLKTRPVSGTAEVGAGPDWTLRAPPALATKISRGSSRDLLQEALRNLPVHLMGRIRLEAGVLTYECYGVPSREKDFAACLDTLQRIASAIG